MVGNGIDGEVLDEPHSLFVVEVVLEYFVVDEIQ